MVFFYIFWSILRDLGRIGRSGKALGFISSNLGQIRQRNAPPKGNNRGAIIIIVIPGNCGAYMGGFFGIIQVLMWIRWSKGWMLPAFGGVVGCLSNWLALKMIFEPVEPYPIFGGRLVIQGLFLKRQREVSAEYGKIVADNILSAKNLIPAILCGRCSDELFNLLHKHIHAACDKYTGLSRPLIKLVRGSSQ